MHIILVSDRMATAKTITLTKRHVAGAIAVLTGLVLLFSSLASFVTLRHIERIPLPYAQNLLLSLRQQEAQKTQEVVRDNLNAMAVKLGEMQARIVRLDTLGERLARLTGIKAETLAEEPAPSAAGRGGPLVMLPPALAEPDLERQLEILALQLETRDDHFGLLETHLLDERVRRSLLPTALPISGAENASGFGWRRDPFNGQRALHEGVDFSVDAGTPILAAAGGVVVAAEYHSAYGNLIEIDHGNDLTTRYAHASRMLVKEGAIVRRGQKIAEVGSTGRSTGPHLHFEVRVKGVARDPKRFIEAARSGDKLLAAALQ
jgi:murein DD-endopeptidase MepM/ murein hydrolase activator NlpD